MLQQYTNGNHPNEGVEYWWGRQKSRFSTRSIASSNVVNAAFARCYQHSAAGQWKVVTLIAGSKRRHLLMAEDDDEVFMTIINLNVTPKTTEQQLVVRMVNLKL